MNDRRFREMIASYMYLKAQRLDDDIRIAVDNLWQMHKPDHEHIERVKECLYRKAEFELTCREIRHLMWLYL